MKDRIKELRKTYLKKTQKEFAVALGMSENYIWMIEKGDRVPPDRTISDICREFSVNRIWLETGKGEPFAELSRNEQITEILAQATISNATARDRLIRAFAQLPDELFPYAERILDEIVRNLTEDK